MLEAVIGVALTICFLVNILASRIGYSSIHSGDKDILLPFCLMIFLFYPLLIYLPETHYKVIAFSEPKIVTIEQAEEDE